MGLVYRGVYCDISIKLGDSRTLHYVISITQSDSTDAQCAQCAHDALRVFRLNGLKARVEYL